MSVTFGTRPAPSGRMDGGEPVDGPCPSLNMESPFRTETGSRHVLAPHFRATAMGETMAPTAASAAARGTTTRTTAPSRTGTTTTRTTGTTTTDSGSPAAQERSWRRPLLPEPAVFLFDPESLPDRAKPSNPPSAPVGRVDAGSNARAGAWGNGARISG